MKESSYAFEHAFGRRGRPWWLVEMAMLVDEGTIRPMRALSLGPIDAATPKRAHALSESGRAVGQIVLEGFAG